MSHDPTPDEAQALSKDQEGVLTSHRAWSRHAKACDVCERVRRRLSSPSGFGGKARQGDLCEEGWALYAAWQEWVAALRLNWSFAAKPPVVSPWRARIEGEE